MDQKVPFHRMSKIRFSAYTSNEITKLSAVEVTNIETVDILGHPSKNGLHDPAMGPNTNRDLCATCGLNSISCPGHMGYISLPLPVYNPFFFSTLYKLLKGSCFKCSCLMAPEVAGHLLLAQLQALDHGLVGLAEELEQIMADDDDDKNMHSMVVMEKLSKMLQDALKTINCEEEMKAAHVKNVVECKQKIIRQFMRDYLSGKTRKCPKCKMPQPGLATYNNCKIVFTSQHKPDNYKAKKANLQCGPQVDAVDGIAIEEEEPENEEAGDDGRVNLRKFLTPTAARNHLRKLWENEGTLLHRLFGAVSVNSDFKDSPADIFFLDVVPVPPSKFRPLSYLNGMVNENPQTSTLKQVLKYAIAVRLLIMKIKSGEQANETSEQVIDQHVKLLIDRLHGRSQTEKMNSAWVQLQVVVNCVLDCDLDKLSKIHRPGVKQILEKKEGLFRKHMMGKRVNYAARSVISPDPYIAVNEIGVPHVFATKLTYPQPVTPWNVEELKQMVINGPNVYPGATLIKNEDGSSVKLSTDNIKQREAVAKQLLTPTDPLNKEHSIKTVYRHLKNGDVLLLNRQPTLHKPSIMAHKARILKREKTLRLHYATCKCYNADFDGDEMNAHFPQSEHGRAEAYSLALVDHQYLVPKDGTPLSGLIQDHVVSGTLMTIRGRFFNRVDYQQLVYAALTFKKTALRLLPPCIQKPQKLWSGKQVLSTVIINVIPENKSLINLEGKSKTSIKNWNAATAREWTYGGSELKDLDMSESEVVIKNGELLCGVLDKAHYGSSQYGLVHCCNELYGGNISVMLLTSFSRLFTIFLQYRGFTLGIEDILVVPRANKRRRKLIKTSTKVGDDYAGRAMNLPQGFEKGTLTQKLCEAHYSRNDLQGKQLDLVMKEATDKFNNEINSVCLPRGLLKKFPHNNLQLMVQSGAKGSTVNTMQISGLLGQIELEGRRPPLMISGHSLPSFLAYDTSPRAGGFVTGRFLTGIRPQEYFFHCMAGREGLVDTAVKTSRSGYLQRCLIKHLEGIVVNYDLTVRDSDGSVIQFFYGDDGLDIPKTQFLKPSQMKFLGENVDSIKNEDHLDQIKALTKPKQIFKHKKKIKKHSQPFESQLVSASSDFLHFSRTADSMETNNWEKMNFKTGRLEDTEQIVQQWNDLNEDQKNVFAKYTERCPDPVLNVFRPDRSFGSVTEKMDALIQDYVGKYGNEFKEMCYMKCMRALCEPGESVGLLAAQSIGEPSTQMTLNTFHFAGRGEMNVTLGIPRLREILMVASQNIATPSMVIPIRPEASGKAEQLRLHLNRIQLDNLLEDVSIKETIHVKSSCNKYRKYILKFKFLPYKLYKDKYKTDPANNLQYMESKFFKILCLATKKKLMTISQVKFVSASTVRSKGRAKEMEEEPAPPNPDPNDGNSSGEEENNEGDTTSAKQKSRHDQEQEYDESDEDESQESSSSSDEEDQEEVTVKQEPMDEDEGNGDGQQAELEDDIGKLKAQRVQNVLGLHEWIVAYDFDANRQEWCEITLKMELGSSKFDIASLVEEEAKRAIVHQVQNINKAMLSPSNEPDFRLTVDGININEMFKYGHILDLNKLYSNHIHAIAKCYGIEAARMVIVKEVVNVFAVYGIEVDYRHLSLIADYMTFEGSYKPFNRFGMESSASPIQQMTFETTLQFLKSAILYGYEDQLQSPSSRLVVGRIVGSGTGSFDLLQKPYSQQLLQSHATTQFSKISHS